MPLGKGVRFRAKQIDPQHYLRMAFKGQKIVEVKKMRYKKK
jgi:hypothetical protein